ncbi:hypothetical protein EZV62_021714 [Acer yangbiense]|uniref:Nucleobase-ascorbate transporter 10 n=1 Tax=Acer yangbiense TaxID=1000413 RepID=A0A5C7H7G3_9ROSI|nr:hypothetical protein EZV62_021714 [Acer yangbiense]
MAQGNGGGGGENKKAEEILPHPHPVEEQLPGIQYCVNSPPPWAEAIVLGFQHYLLTLGITVLIPSIIVPQMGGGNGEKVRVIQTLLFVSGFSTFFQSLFGTRLPTVSVGSYVYLIPITSIVMAKRYNSYIDPYEVKSLSRLVFQITSFKTLILSFFFFSFLLCIFQRFVMTMRGIQGALIASGCFQMVMGFLGLWRNAVRYLSPLSVVPYVTFTGLGLYHLGFPMLANCVEIGLPGLFAMVFISQASGKLDSHSTQQEAENVAFYLHRYMQTKRPIYDRFAVLFSVAIAWLFAQILTSSTVYNKKPEKTQISCRTDQTGLLTAAPWVYFPYPFQWGSPTFNVGETFAMLAASFVSLSESTGTFYAVARYGSATPVPPSVISRGIGWQGIGVLLNGMFGSVTGLTASVENAGLLALTKVGSRRVIQVSAGFMIFFSIFGKFGAIFASIPMPVVAALYCILFGYVSSAGLGFLQFCNLNSFKTKFILGFSFFMGLSVPQFFREYYLGGFKPGQVQPSSNWFNDIMVVIFMSHATVAAMVALFFDCTLSRENDETRKDSGLKWWEKFSLYNSDVRNDEFYGLPCRLNKLFPAL